MSTKSNIDDIEQMFTDIIRDTSPIVSGNPKGPTEPAEHYEHVLTDSGAQTPAEPLEFTASPIEKTAQVLQVASKEASRRNSRRVSRSVSRSASRSRSRSASGVRRHSSTVEDLAVDMPEELQKALSTPPHEGGGHKIPSLYVSTPTHRSSARLEKLIKNGDHEAIRRERESTSLGVLSPNDSDNPENAIMEAIRRASSNRGSRTASRNGSVSSARDSAIGEGYAPTKPALHRRVSSNVIEETDEVVVRPMRIPEAAESETVAANTTANPEAAIEKAIRRASLRDSTAAGSPPQSPRTKRLESLASQGSPQQIRAERESTSVNVLDPTDSAAPENAIESAFRRASTDSGIRRDSTISANLEADPEAAMEQAIRRASHSSERPASIAASRRRSSRLEAISSGLYSPKPRRKSSVLRASGPHSRPAPTCARRPSEAERLGSISNSGTPDDIAAERRRTSQGIVSPNLTTNAEDAIATAYRRASTSSHRKSSTAQEMERIAKESPQKIRAERESTSVGIPDPSDSSDPVEAITEAIAGTTIEPSDPTSKTPASAAAQQATTGITDPTNSANPVTAIKDAINQSQASPSDEKLRTESLSKRRPSSVSEDSSLEEAKKSILEEQQSISSEGSVPVIVEQPEEEAKGESEEPKEPKEPTRVNVSPPTPRVQFNKNPKVLSPESANVAKEIDPTSLEPKADALAKQEPTPTAPAAPTLAENPAPVHSADTVYLYVSMATGGRGAMKNFQMAKTILDSYKIEFTPVEITMDERAKRLWKHRGIAKNKKLPAVVRDGEIKLDYEALLAANEEEEVDEIIFEEF